MKGKKKKTSTVSIILKKNFNYLLSDWGSI